MKCQESLHINLPYMDSGFSRLTPAPLFAGCCCQPCATLGVVFQDHLIQSSEHGGGGWRQSSPFTGEESETRKLSEVGLAVEPGLRPPGSRAQARHLPSAGSLQTHLARAVLRCLLQKDRGVCSAAAHTASGCHWQQHRAAWDLPP